MAETHTAPSIDEYLRKRLMPVEGAIPHLPGIEMYGNSVPAEAVGGDLFEYINFEQRYDIDARIQRALKRHCRMKWGEFGNSCSPNCSPTKTHFAEARNGFL